MSVENTFLFIIIASGSALLHRICCEWSDQHLLQRRHVPIIVTVFICYSIITLRAFDRSVFFHSTLLVLPLIFIPLMRANLQQKRRSRLDHYFYRFINQLILMLKTGVSLPLSLQKIARKTPAEFRGLLRQIDTFVSFSQQNQPRNTTDTHGSYEIYVRLFHHVATSQTNKLMLLEALRERLRVERNFRHKSRQATLQMRVQVFIVSIFFVMTCVFSFRSLKTSDVIRPFGFALCLFLAGLTLMIVLGRKKSWKV